MNHDRMRARGLTAALTLAAALGACKDRDANVEPSAPYTASTLRSATREPALAETPTGAVPVGGIPYNASPTYNPDIGGSGIGGSGTGGMGSAALMGDGDVLSVLAASDGAEIQQGAHAQAHALSPRVRAYGRMMATTHANATSRMTALRQRLNLTPQENSRSRALISDATATQTRLEALRGAEFDQAYVDAQVTQHAQVLETLDTALLPAARNPELHAALLSDVRPMVASHLQRARELQRSFTTSAAPTPVHGTAPHPTH